jgi:hypothetical protein
MLAIDETGTLGVQREFEMACPVVASDKWLRKRLKPQDLTGSVVSHYGHWAFGYK